MYITEKAQLWKDTWYLWSHCSLSVSIKQARYHQQGVAIECMHRTDRDGSLTQCFAFCLFFTLFCFCEWWVLFLVSVFSAWSFCYFCLYLYFRLSCFPCISRVQLLSLPQLGVLMFWLLPVLFCHSLPFVCFMFRFLPHYLDSVNLSSFTIISCVY